MLFEFFTLFVLAFFSATLLPGGSEVYLLHLSTQTNQETTLYWLWLTASIANTLGAFVNYALGRFLLHYQHRRWFPIKPQQLPKAQNWFQRYGQWSLLMSWAPIVGDALTLIAGIMKVNFWQFALLVFIGKALRYAIILGLFAGLKG